MIFPPYLQKGDTIGIILPAGYMPLQEMQTCIKTLQKWGYHIKLGNNIGKMQQNYFAATDEERKNELQAMLDDASVQAILCARGGYGVSKIIDGISFKKFKRNPKWIIGFSDITALHAHVNSNCNIASLHGPMAAAFNNNGYKTKYIRYLRNALEGIPNCYSIKPHVFNNIGNVKAALIGGNLALLAHLIGTKSFYKPQHKILFIEDVGEYLYNIDRMMLQLYRAGVLTKISGLIIGSFSNLKDTVVPYGKNVEEIIYQYTHQLSIPVCYNFPVGHVQENVTLKVGATYHLSVQKNKVELLEL